MSCSVVGLYKRYLCGLLVVGGPGEPGPPTVFCIRRVVSGLMVVLVYVWCD